MDDRVSAVIGRLAARGWLCRRSARPAALPPVCAGRYSWLPDEVVSLVCGFDRVISPDDKAWFVTAAFISGTADTAFAWNQWELDSLDAAAGDAGWQRAIRAFWDRHFPILLSVKSGYAYAAVTDAFAVVVGEEPEFEETVKVAEDVHGFLTLVAQGGRPLDRLIGPP